jgi:hypothetical protein
LISRQLDHRSGTRAIWQLIVKRARIEGLFTAITEHFPAQDAMISSRRSAVVDEQVDKASRTRRLHSAALQRSTQGKLS